jgi:hypothetical protein
MKQRWATFAVTGVMAAAGTVVATPAEAAAPTLSAQVVSVSKVHLIGRRPYVAGSYSCTGTYTHLWVSAKQGKGDLTEEGSGRHARAWWERTKDQKLNCDGDVHTIVVRLRRTQQTAHTGRLIPEPRGRKAYVQFCLVIGNQPDLSDAFPDGFSSDMHYRSVIRG